MRAPQLELPDYVAKLATAPSLEGRRQRASLTARFASAAQAMLADAERESAELLERARAEATALVEQARVEAKAQLEQAPAEAKQLTPSMHEKAADPPVRLADASTGKDGWTLPFEPPPLSPEDLVATRPLPRFFGRGSRGLR